ncbi:hotdog fold domain-containing protein [Jeongeupia wiesaeckerbachi]|uniref:hotdog fold domain-containing protein n=1 Tax=Jeongeupia wiesaeckerbachi TaxID=3051218 RepID=UPI003D809E44
MARPNAILHLWLRCSRLPAGRWLFSRLVCFKAPYFGSISPRFVQLAPGRCELSIAKRRKVLNHIGTVHAIAMCNMAELAAGTMTDVTIPASHRWIPKGMQVDYLKKAETGLRAVATVAQPAVWGDGLDLPVKVDVIDAAGQIVVRATITMWVSAKKR